MLSNYKNILKSIIFKFKNKHNPKLYEKRVNFISFMESLIKPTGEEYYIMNH